MSAVAVDPVVDEVDPRTAYRLLDSGSDAVLIDVRTRAEWSFVGLPEISATGRPLWLVEWASFPEMAPNPAFLDQLMAEMRGMQGGESGGDPGGESENDSGPPVPGRMLFLCRSGARSMAAARAVAAALAAEGIATHCTNVAEGFEGDLDAEGHRGRLNGWRARGLPWRQR